jgi:putative copper export protein
MVGGAGVLAGATLDLGLLAHELEGPGALGGTLLALLWTPSGAVWLARCAGVLLLAGLSGLAPAVPPRGWPIARAALTAGIVLVGALSSHSAATTDGRLLALGAEALHLLAMALWVGGLLAFATVFWRVPMPQRLVLAIPAFSQVAVCAVGILALTGLVLARLHLTAWHELVTTPYGRVLAAKVLVFAAMLALASGHLRYHAKMSLRTGVGETRGVRHFRGRLRLEAALAVAALALAALLGSTRPPDPPPEGGLEVFREVTATPEAQLRLELTPFRPGPVTVRLAVSDPRGWPLQDARAALLQLVPRGSRVGPLTLDLEREAPGVFGARVAALGMAGEWEGRLVVQREGAYDVNHRFTILVPAALGPPRRAFPLDLTTGVAAAASALATLALFLRSRRRLQASRVLLAHPPSASPDAATGGHRV